MVGLIKGNTASLDYSSCSHLFHGGIQSRWSRPCWDLLLSSQVRHVYYNSRQASPRIPSLLKFLLAWPRSFLHTWLSLRTAQVCAEFWRQFCDSEGGGVYDPEEHGAPFLRQDLRSEIRVACGFCAEWSSLYFALGSTSYSEL